MRHGSEDQSPRRRRPPWRGPHGTHEVVEYLFRHHFDEVVEKLGRHPYTRGTSRSYREGLASEVLKRMLESQQLEHFEPGAVGTWIVQAVYRHRNETDRGHVRLSVTEGDLEAAQARVGLGDAEAAPGLDAFEAPSALEPPTALDDKQQSLAGLELRAQLPTELQQLYQLRWEQGLPPRRVRDHFGWSRKQYEKRDARLKAIVMDAVEHSAPNSIVPGRGDGTICRQTRELLPLVLRATAALDPADRLRVDAHLLACLSCQATARQAKRVLAHARPLFVPVDAGIGGGALIGGGLMAQLWGKAVGALGLGGGGGAVALKATGVAGCVAACFAGSDVLLQRETAKDVPDQPRQRAAARRPADTRTPTPSPRTTTVATARPNPPDATAQPRAHAEKPRIVSRRKSVPTVASTTSSTPAVAATEFLPEASSPAAATTRPTQAAAPQPSPASSAEFAGP